MLLRTKLLLSVAATTDHNITQLNVAVSYSIEIAEVWHKQNVTHWYPVDTCAWSVHYVCTVHALLPPLLVYEAPLHEICKTNVKTYAGNVL